jgi:hypothetical protein
MMMSDINRPRTRRRPRPRFLAVLNHIIDLNRLQTWFVVIHSDSKKQPFFEDEDEDDDEYEEARVR